MLNKESSYPADWLRLAERDWERVPRLLDDEDPELAGFCLQQALEKFLKAFLLTQPEWHLRRIHSLDALLEDAVAYEPSLERFRDVCQRITAFYFIERYPLVTDASIAQEDVRSAMQQVTELVRKLRSSVSRKGAPA